jgi:hypothetical protein
MHTQETQQKFIERLAQGWTYVRIMTELGVAKSTLIEWSRKFRFEINNLKAIEMNDLQTRILGTVQSRVTELARKLTVVEEEIRKRDLTQVPTTRLFLLAETLRREIAREFKAITFVTPTKAIPDDEYIDEVQEWKP